MSIRIRVSGAIIKDDSILLVRHEKAGKAYWLLPGGGVEEQETLHRALVREIKEETSLEIEPQELLFVCESISPAKGGVSPAGRHVLHIAFKSKIIEGKLKVNQDKRLKEAAFFNAKDLAEVTIYPDVKNELIELIQTEGKVKKVKYLGNRWH